GTSGHWKRVGFLSERMVALQAGSELVPRLSACGEAEREARGSQAACLLVGRLSEQPRGVCICGETERASTWRLYLRQLECLSSVAGEVGKGNGVVRAWQGVAEVLLDDNAISQMPRPGTSLSRPLTQSAGQPNAGVRPVTSSGRPLTGFARPGTNSGRPGTGSQGVEGAFASGRPGTSRPVTSSGRFVRLGTASMLSEPGGPFINVDKLDLRKYAARPALARVLCDYILYHDHNPKKSVELCALATVQAEYQDWWWKARLGKSYYQLGLFRDAEKQFKSSLKNVDNVISTLELCKSPARALAQPAVVLPRQSPARALAQSAVVLPRQSPARALAQSAVVLPRQSPARALAQPAVVLPRSTSRGGEISVTVAVLTSTTFNNKLLSSSKEVVGASQLESRELKSQPNCKGSRRPASSFTQGSGGCG
ncbi:hypothetical protein CYMTET_41875, partial [Cymbomonas tetramitiformis]